MGNLILVVEDEESIRELIGLNLQAAGYTVELVADGTQALTKVKAVRPDLILLDWMLPGLDGLDVLRHLKADPQMATIPVMMLTAKSEESDIVLGLELGACDYITKPFSNKVLVARVRAQLRSGIEQEQSDEIRYDSLVMNTLDHTAKLDGNALDLTFTEYGILRLLAKRPGRVFTRDQIVSKVKGDDYPVTDRAIDVQIVNLRRKLGTWGTHIETVRGVGYRMKAPY